MPELVREPDILSSSILLSIAKMRSWIDHLGFISSSDSFGASLDSVSGLFGRSRDVHRTRTRQEAQELNDTLHMQQLYH